jgi:hypothetical protein
MVKLYLDDIRNPQSPGWSIVRSYEEFCSFITEFGVPELISFDHDLGDGVPTGMDCAKWLVENEYPVKQINVHSANPVGRANIEGLLNNWKDFCRGRDL